MANYVDNKKLLEQIIISKENGKLTDDAWKMFFRMVKEISTEFKYQYPEDREDCNASAVEDILRYWKQFDPDHPKANVFAFYTQMIKRGIAKGFHKIRPVKMRGNISLDKDDTFLNF